MRASNSALARLLGRISGAPPDDPRQVAAWLGRALDQTTGPRGGQGRPVQILGQVHDRRGYRRWRDLQLRRLPGAFVPQLEEGRWPLVLWAVKPASLPDFLQGRRKNGLLTAPHVGMFLPDVPTDVGLAATLISWLDDPQGPWRLAPPLLAEHGRWRVADLGRAWPLPRTELITTPPAP